MVLKPFSLLANNTVIDLNFSDHWGQIPDEITSLEVKNKMYPKITSLGAVTFF